MFHTRLFNPAGGARPGTRGARFFESMWAARATRTYPASRPDNPFQAGANSQSPTPEVMDPFVVLSAAAVVTKTPEARHGRVASLCSAIPFQTAKLVASIDQVSGGRFLFGVGGGWNAEEIEGPRPLLSKTPLQS